MYTTILAKYYSKFMEVEQIKEHMQEHFTLLNIYKSYISEDESAKNGRYLDIVANPSGVKFYSKNLGYGSILPFIYRAGNVFPLEAIQELASPFGVKSSSQ